VKGPDGIATTVPQLRLLVPPDPKEARAVRERIAAFVRDLGVDEEALHDIVTVIGEAFANVVQHASTREPIELTTWLEDGTRLLARIVDRGRGFPSADAARPTEAPDDALAERGRGMWIMSSCSDMLSVDSLPGLGTAIVFARNVRGGPSRASRNR
jgi:anti-sigma regulatory factor (Ser/Thr protein kinase)